MLVVLWLACSSEAPEINERALFSRCQVEDLDACYQLAASSSDQMREHGLRKSCRHGFQDSCRRLFQWRSVQTGLEAEGTAFAAALNGCTKNRDVSLCHELLAFAERGERFVPMVEKQRAAVEAVLRQAAEESAPSGQQ